MTSSYPRRETTVDSAIKEIRNCTEFPSLALPKNLVLPPLPSPARDREFAPGFIVTTHLVPASYPRYSYQEPTRYSTTISEVLNDAPPDSAPKDMKRKWAFETASKLLKKRYDLYRARVEHLPKDTPEPGLGPVLWIVLNRYARTKPAKVTRNIGLTVILCHANGLHKEVRV